MQFSKLKILPPKVKIPPLLFLALGAAIAAAITLEHGHLLRNGIGIGVIVTTTCVSFAICTNSQKKSFIAIVLATIGVFVTRTSYVCYSTTPSWVVCNDGDLIKLSGTVISNPICKRRTTGAMSLKDDREQQTTFEFHASPEKKDSTCSNHLFVAKVNGDTNLSKGDEIEAIGKIKRNKFSASGSTYYYIDSPELIQKKRTERSAQQKIEVFIKNKIVSGTSGRVKTLVFAVFFGEHINGWTELSQVFRKSGLSHLLAVSGLHIAIVIVVLLRIGSLISQSKTGRVLITCVAALLLLVLIQNRPPVVRATLMSIFISLLHFKGQRYDGLGITTLIFLWMVWDNPVQIQQVGFILSFSVVAGLFVLLPTLKWKLIGPTGVFSTLLETTRHKLASLWTVGFCALLISAPITVYLFGTIALASLVTNVGGVFLLFCILFFGLLRVIVGWIHPAIDSPLFFLLQQSSQGLIHLADTIGSVPLAVVSVPKTTELFLVITFTYVILASVMLRYQKTKFLLYCTYLLILFLKPNESAVQITTLNVGHGTSHIVIDAHATLLVDVGSRVNLDVGLTVLLPELKRLGVREIDKVIITHNDLDHCSGILDLFEHYKVQELFITPHTLKNQTKTIEKILFSAKSNGVFVKEIHKGWQTETKNVTVRSIWPEKTRVHSSSNEASVVLLVEAENRRVLLTGDINEAAISEVALQNLPVIDVLELPHHGQWSEESLGFVEELQPKVVLQSTSKRRFSSDKWLLPNTAERYVTCIDGHITTEITKKGELRVTTTYTKHNDLY